MGRPRRAYAYESGPPPVDVAVARAAAASDGVLSTSELTALGMSRDQRLRRARTGRLHLVHPGVYAVGHPLLSPRGRWRAAVLACGPDAVLSHRDAALLWGIRASARARIDVTTPRRGRAGLAGIDVHRVRSLDPADATTHAGLPVTTVARTLLDLADVVDDGALARAVHQSEVLRLLDVRAVDELCARANGRRGVGRLRALVATPAAPTESELEDRFLELCDRAGLPRPLVNAQVGRFRVDALWPAHRLVVELDGAAVHHTRRAFERDRERDVELAVAGFHVVRFTWRRITGEPGAVAATLRALLA